MAADRGAPATRPPLNSCAALTSFDFFDMAMAVEAALGMAVLLLEPPAVVRRLFWSIAGSRLFSSSLPLLCLSLPSLHTLLS